MEIPCKVTVKMSPTVKNTQLMDRLMELEKTLYSERHLPITLGSLLADELEVQFLSNKTGQKLLKTRKEETARRKIVNATKSFDIIDMFRRQEAKRQRVEKKSQRQSS